METREVNERALKGREETLGPMHLDTLTSVHNVGLLYQSQAKLTARAEDKEMKPSKGQTDPMDNDLASRRATHERNETISSIVRWRPRRLRRLTRRAAAMIMDP